MDQTGAPPSPARPPEGCYARVLSPLPVTSGPARGALFLDRDGVINTDTGYLHEPEKLELRPGIAERIGDARRAGLQTVIVTNQSGIGRGYFGWDAFKALQDLIYAGLLERDPDARISLTCACPFHRAAALPQYTANNHPWRKPNPGMLDHAVKVLGLDRAASHMLGDRSSDEGAARAAGVAFSYV